MTARHSLHKLHLILYSRHEKNKIHWSMYWGGKQGIHNPLMLTNIPCSRTGVSEEVPRGLRLNLAQEMQTCDAKTNVTRKSVHL